jgi:hypothetical protein
VTVTEERLPATTLLIIGAGLGTLVLASAALRPWATAHSPSAAGEAFTPPPLPADVLRPFSFGFSSATADFMFLQAIQVFGGRRGPETEAGGAATDLKLARLLEYATELDPKFRGAYRFAGNALPRSTPEGKFVNVMPAAQILTRGARERPDDWQIPFLLGYFQAFYLQELPSAARSLDQAAHAKGAPAYLGLLATRVAAQGGELQLAQQMAETMVEQATEEKTREEWEARVVDLKMESSIREIESATRRFHARTGRWPESLHEIVRAGDLPRIPAEPHGGEYRLAADGTVTSTAAARPILRHPKDAQ